MVEKDDTLNSVIREFKRIHGQKRVKEFISRSLDKDTFPHGVMIYGGKGMGHSALLLDIADQILCESNENAPCGKCFACLEKAKPSHENLIPVFPMLESRQKNEEMIQENSQEKLSWVREDPYGYFHELKEHISIGQVRHLKKKLGFAALSKTKRVVLIFGIETMMVPAANALLKLLEEPPANVYFLLSCENRNRVLPTIISRCISLGLSPLSHEELNEFVDSEKDLQSEMDKLMTVSSGSPGVFMDFKNNGGTELLQGALEFIQNSFDAHWMEFESYLTGSPNFSDMAASVKTLNTVLELITYWNTNKGLETPSSSDIWDQLDDVLTTDSVENQLSDYIQFVTASQDAISKYVSPLNALLGQFLKREKANEQVVA